MVMWTTEHHYINISQMFHIHVKEAHCCCVVFCGMCGIRIISDVATELRRTDTCTYAHLHAPTHFI